MFKHLRILTITGAAVLPLMITAIPAHAAGSTTTTFSVTATVVDSCKINSAGNLAFGNYDPTSATATTGTSSISVNCTKNDAYTIALNYGVNGGSASNRILSDGATPTADLLDYNLYTDSLHSNVWNSTCTAGNNCGSGTGAGPGAGNAQTYTVYGQIAAGQNVPAGSYSDTITVTVNF